MISKGSLEGLYPGLIMANGARMEGIEADLFFTFFGLDAIRKDRYEKIKVATVGNPGMHLPTWIGAIPGFSALATRMMKRQMEKIDIPPIPEFIELVADSGDAPLRLQGDRRHVRTHDGRLRPPGRGDHQRRRVLREGRRRPGHLQRKGSVREMPRPRSVRRWRGRSTPREPRAARASRRRARARAQVDRRA